jgi:tRNA pseudouridine38-40 synthase
MHIKMSCEYDGAKFYGFATQRNKRTVQGDLERALSKYFGTPIKVVGAGRTDKGVSAKGQVISLLCPRPTDLAEMTESVNKTLKDIRVYDAELRDKFNARSDAKSKVYAYKIKSHADINKINAATKYLVGKNNFAAFTCDLRDKSPVKTIYSIYIAQDGDEITFTIRGDGFLKHMVRYIVATLLTCPQDTEKILLSRDNRLAPKPATAKGLTLLSVEF